MADNFTYVVEKQDKLKIKVSIKVTPKYFSDKKKEVFNKLKSSVQIKGFRPGMAPKNLIEAKLGPALFEETINKILPEIAIEVLRTEKLNPINQLHYHLEKVSEADGLHYHIEFEVMPEVKLPDFAKIKAKKEVVDVTKKEVDAVIEDMFSRGQKSSSQKTSEKKADDKKTGEKAEKVEKKPAKADKKSPDDKWAAGIGLTGVKTIKDLQKEVEKQLAKQKESLAEEKYRAEILDKSVIASKIQAPSALVERELENREKSYRQRIEGVGLKFDEFLKSRKTTVDDLKKEWQDDAEKRIAREILLIEVAKSQDMRVTQDDIKKELENIKDPEIKKQYESDKGKSYIATVLIQQKAIEWITKQIQ